MACDAQNDVCLYIDDTTKTSVRLHLWEIEGSGVYSQAVTLYASDGTTVVDTATTPASGSTYVTFSGLSPNTQYIVKWDRYPVTAETFTTLEDLPRTALESQWEDLANKVKEKAVITMTDTDPGEGSPLAANHFIAYYA